MSACNTVIRKESCTVWLHLNVLLCTAISDCCMILQESMAASTRCRELVIEWPNYVGVKDTSATRGRGLFLERG